MILVVGSESLIELFRNLIDFMPVTTNTALIENVKGILLTGGPDVDPSLYGHRNLYSFTSPARDKQDLGVFKRAVGLKKPLFGICRGFQFLNVMAGGKMIQNVTGHTGKHNIISFENRIFRASSTHHQMVVPPKSAIVTAISWEKRSKSYIYEEERIPPVEVESAYFPNIRAFGTQWHPEFDLLEGISESVNFFRRHLSLLLSGALEGKLKEYSVPRMGKYKFINKRDGYEAYFE